MVKLLSLTNPKRKKKYHAKKAAKKIKKARKIKVKVKKYIKRKKAVKQMKKRKSIKKSVKRRKAIKRTAKVIRRKHRRNPSRVMGLSVPKVNLMDIGKSSALVGAGIAGQLAVSKYLMPMIPGYSTLTGWPKFAADVAAAVVVPVALGSGLSALKIKGSKDMAAAIGTGMVGSVFVSKALENETVKTALLSPATSTSVSALVTAIPQKSAPYGLGKLGFDMNIKPGDPQIF